MYFFAAFWVTLISLDQTKYRNDTDYTYSMYITNRLQSCGNGS